LSSYEFSHAVTIEIESQITVLSLHSIHAVTTLKGSQSHYYSKDIGKHGVK